MAASTIDHSTYWIVAVPNSATPGGVKEQSPEAKLKLFMRELDMKTHKFAESVPFRIPALRVGTLDSLMTLSDELVKMDQQVEQTVKKLEKTFRELKGDHELLVEGMSAGQYVERFEWNSATFPKIASLHQISNQIHSEVVKYDDDVRKKTAELADVQQTLGAIERKETGTLLVKPLGQFVKPRDLIEREFLTTLLVVIPSQRQKHFLSTYEILEKLAAEEERKKAEQQKDRDDSRESNNADKEDRDEEKEHSEEFLQSLTDEQRDEYERRRRARQRGAAVANVVPRSAKLLHDDGEFSLYRIIVFKKGADTIRNLCRTEKYTVRSYEHDPEQMESDKGQREDLSKKKTQLLTRLIRWCEVTYSDVFNRWIHLKAIRVFVESVLRYGIPVDFSAALLKPRKGYRPKLREVLNDMYSKLSGQDLINAEDQGADIFSGLGNEFFPYVYTSIDLEHDA